MGSQEPASSLRGHELLDRVAVLRSACDLDLLLFFARHPRSLLTSEHIARFLGYEHKQLAASLDEFTAAGIVTRIQNRTRVTQLLVFSPGGSDGGTLPWLLKLASTREGRVSLMRALATDRDQALSARTVKPSRVVVGG